VHPRGEPQLVPAVASPVPRAQMQVGLCPNSDLCVSEQELGREHRGKIVNTVPGFLGKKEIGKRDYELALK
uniref:Uncharacterized protein n=1 Tax=Cercocebus atys TaxID=9531 RepID=A0A2K5M6U4_CERAT